MSYHLLIVEDENVIRQGMVKIIRKMNLDLSIDDVGHAHEALEKISVDLPDIVITDIMMPDMNGLQFIAETRKISERIQFIIISGYNDFSYAQDAIRLGVKEYFVKPLDKEKLLSCIKKIVKNIEVNKYASIQMDKSFQYESKIERMKSLLLKDLIQNPPENNEVNQILKDTGIVSKEGNIYNIFITSFSKQTPADHLRHRLIDNLKVSLADNFKIELIFDNQFEQTVFLLSRINTGKNRRKIDLDIEKHLEFISYEFKTNIWAAISEPVESLFKLNEEYLNTLNALDMKLLRGTSHLFTYADIGEPIQHVTVYHFIDSICSAVMNQDEKEVLLSTNNLFQYLVDLDDINPASIKMLIMQIFQKLHEQKKSLFIYRDFEMWINESYRTSETFTDFTSEVKSRLMKILHNMKEDRDTSSIVGYAISFAEKNYAQKLTLDHVASIVNMHPNYFSTLFKKKTNVNFTRYVQLIRVEKAKYLLKNPVNKIYVISEQVGFNDAKYFCRVFRELTGLSPQEYRQNIIDPSQHLKELNSNI